MLDINSISKRYFTIKIDEIVLEVEPPTKKALSKIIELTKSNGIEMVNGLFAAVEMILNKNKTGYKVSENMIDKLDMDQVQEILNQYFKWMNEVKNSPN